MANTGQYDSQTNIETEDYEREIFVRPEAAVIYGGSVVNSVNGQVGDVVLTTSDLENTSDYQTGAQVQNAIAGKQDKLTAGTNIQINNNVISATGTTYSAGSGLNLDGTTFSVDTNIIATVQDVTDEATIRENSDANLQGQIDALLDSKQNVIADLPQIRSGAEAGATAVQPEDLARIATTGSYNDSLDKPSINNVALIGNISLDALGIQPKGDYALESEIPDVSNFITNTVDNLVNYYKKSETFTKQEVNDLISAITTMDIQVVQTLPTEDISTTTIYFVPKTTAGPSDVYDEYVYVSNAWEHIGSTDIDLSGYQTKIDSSHKLSSDLVDDANQTNKFVTENEKTTWNTEIENLQEEDELLKRNLQTTTGSGEEVTLEKTTELDFVKPPLPRGNTKQDTTTGKNLLNTINANTTTINGVTSYRSNGVYYLSGTNTKTNATWVLPNTQNTNLPVFEIGQTYTMSFKGTMPNGVYAQLNAVSASTGTQYSIGSVRNTVPSLTFTIDSDYSSTAQLFIGIQPTVTNADCNFAIQIEKGSTATSYEPYTGGQPSPNPDYPQEVEVVTGNVGVTISNNDNSESKTLPVSLGNIELCKLGDYQDYFYKESNKWYLHKEIDKVVLYDNKTYNFYKLTGDYNQVNALLGITNINTQPDLFKCSHFDYYDKATSATKTRSGARIFDTNVNFVFSVPNKIANSMVDWKNWLTNNNVIIFYVLATPTSTEITDVTLISQLEEISKTLSYQGQTNITSNTIALFDVEAYQSTKLVLEDISNELDTKVSNTDYAGPNKSGVIRTNPDYGTGITSVGALISATKTYQQYQNTTTPNMFISKGTLENVITGKGLDLKQLSTFDSTKTQILKNINGSLIWVDE